MGIMDFFKAKENKRLKQEVEELRNLLTPEQKEVRDISDYLLELQEKKDKLVNQVEKLNEEISDLINQKNIKKKELITLDEEVLMQDFGLYQPKYDFVTSEQYKAKLDDLRKKQKQMIKDKTAVHYSTNWTVDGSKAKGTKMTNDNIKQILRSFNTECENAIDRVKFNNIDSMKKRIEKSFESLNKLNETVHVGLKPSFLNLKIEELYLAYEYQVKKQEEKEEQKRIREELREQAKLKKELEEARKNIDKDLKHFTNALESLNIQLNNNEITQEQREALLNKKNELEGQINTLTNNLKDIDYRQENQKAGYVYVISNIGAFGEDIYKIGMTRRLNPQDRIDELGDASVPFNFDVHAMIFAEDAPALENALHKAFDNKKVNMINQRREFFNVKLEEIEKVIRNNFDNTVEFIKIPEAEQYRESVKIREQYNRN
ncbi:MAG: DUF4041 domain-containing protein [Clostridium sp.]|uniref:DUF4041 domain-containing protein n=1 Tax=Clostridium sp. TaxID=1506 RepID=UPI002A7FCBAB|nr:DUF4041 domain-containing protein [Clostridium sp.]MCI6694000.1 DUF4041 domain-containing protein [Clostridium sp.]MDY4252607.1 DUF4041 domain-containing protein [Clostridium sp.]